MAPGRRGESDAGAPGQTMKSTPVAARVHLRDDRPPQPHRGRAAGTQRLRDLSAPLRSVTWIIQSDLARASTKSSTLPLHPVLSTLFRKKCSPARWILRKTPISLDVRWMTFGREKETA